MASTYIDPDQQQRTCVVTRDDSPTSTVPPASKAVGYTQPMQVKRRLLDDISIPQVIAGAAAAATSMVLASQIGIAGSVIGAAVSSAVTVISSQLYRHFLDASAEKLKRGSDALKDAAFSHAGASDYPQTTGSVHPSDTCLGRASDAADATRLMTTQGVNGQPIHGARVAPAKLRARAAAERSESQRKVVLFSVAAAAAAVAICTIAILVFTGGAGIGTKTEPLFAPQATVDEPAANSNDTETAGTAPAPETTPPDTAEPQSPSADSSTPSNGAVNSGTSTGTTGDSGTGSSDSNSSASTGGTSGTDTGTGNSGAASDGTSSGSGATSNDSTAGNTSGAPNGTDGTGGAGTGTSSASLISSGQ